MVFIVMVNRDDHKTPFERFTSLKPKVYDNLIHSGHTGHAKMHQKLKPTGHPRHRNSLLLGTASISPRTLIDSTTPRHGRLSRAETSNGVHERLERLRL